MSLALANALPADIALTSLDETIIRRARTLYVMGFAPGAHSRAAISAAQMAAVEERIRVAESLAHAKQSVKGFLFDQIEKLQHQAERSGKLPTSWAGPPQTGGGLVTLGDTLRQWIVEEKYLGDKIPAGLDRLQALRRFWERFHGLYRYQAVIGQMMPLESVRGGE